MNKKPILLIVSLLGGLSLSSCESIKPVETVKIDVWAPKNEEQVINAVIEDWNSSHSKKYQFSITEFASSLSIYSFDLADSNCLKLS